MESPFVDFIEVEQEKTHNDGFSTENFSENEFEFEDPFVKFSENFDISEFEEFHEENNLNNGTNFFENKEFSFEADELENKNYENWPSIAVEFENELSDSNLRKAIEENKINRDKYGWRKYGNELFQYFGIVNLEDLNLNLAELSKKVAEWQITNKYNNANGIIGLWVWSVLQEKLGLHNFSQFKSKIDVDTAIKHNKKYERELWGKNKKLILEKINKGNHLSDEYFAYAVASFQALMKLKIDGSLGPNTLSVIDHLAANTTKPTTSTPIQNKSKWHEVIPDAKLCTAIPLVDGIETFAAMVKAIMDTDKGDCIYILGWMLDIDFDLMDGVPFPEAKGPCTLANLLIWANERKVKIRVQVWSNPDYSDNINRAEKLVNKLEHGKFLVDKATFGTDYIRKAQVMLTAALNEALKIIPYPFNQILENIPKFKKIKSYAALSNEGSHHEKIVIIKTGEDLTGFCGGIDINPNRIKGIDEKGRSIVPHDIHCQLHGHAAWELLKRFKERWDSNIEYLTLNRIYFDASNLDLIKMPDEPGHTKYRQDASFVKIFHTYNKWDGSIKNRSIKDTLKKVIEKAEYSVRIEDQYMVSCEIASWLNLKLRKMKDFKVSIHTQHDEFAKGDMQIPKRKRDEFIRVLKDGALTPSNISISIFTQNEPKLSHHQIHSKYYKIDNSLIIIGSANCNRRSMQFDSETAAFIFNDEKENNFYSRILTKEKEKEKDSWVENYKPSPYIDDLDTEIINEIRAKSIVAAFSAPVLPKLIDQFSGCLVKYALDKLWEILDPNPDGVKCVSNVLEANEFYETESSVFEQENTLASPTNLKFSASISTYFSPEINLKKTKVNLSQLVKSGISIQSLTKALSNSLDLGFIELFLTDMNSRATDSPYSIDKSYSTLDSVITEAIHQFQISNFINPNEHDGILGQSTLDTLGFYNHGLTPKVNSSSFYGQKVLNGKDLKGVINLNTNDEFSNINWFTGIVKPSWLGVKISQGVHVLLYRQLKKAEEYLLSLLQHNGLSKAELGIKLGFNKDSSFSGARLSSEKQGMHGVGLAIDINISGNPWIGAGWQKTDTEKKRMLLALKKASGENLNGSIVSNYLHDIATRKGFDTYGCYDELKLRNDQFVSYIKSNSAELKVWNASFGFGSRNPLNGFLNLDRDLVYALRHVAGLGWGAIDFGPNASGDIMHFDLRPIKIGLLICKQLGGFVPNSNHPNFSSTSYTSNEDYENRFGNSNDITSFEQFDEYFETHEENEDQNIFQNYTSAEKLKKVSDWARLLTFKVNDLITANLRRRLMSVQYAHNESYSNDLNTDFYRVKISRFPVINGMTLKAEMLIKYIRLNINSFIDTSYSSFYPYDSSIDSPVWNSPNPTGAVMKINIKGPDNATVVVSVSSTSGWRFSTVKSHAQGRHPVSGHRDFFIGKDSETGYYYFVVKGLDMMSTGIAGMGFPFLGAYGFSQADKLWKSMMQKVIKFINTNGGWATSDIIYSERVEWRYVYWRYKQLLEDAFGKGAGSSENSSFITLEKNNEKESEFQSFENFNSLNEAFDFSFQPNSENFYETHSRPIDSSEVDYYESENEFNYENITFEDLETGNDNYENEEYAYEKEDGHEHFTDEESFENLNEFENFTNDFSNAIILNRHYSKVLGWNQYYNQINDLLIPFSGQSGVSLGENAFAEALAKWQKKQGFVEKDSDGTLGPKTWSKLKLIITILQITISPVDDPVISSEFSPARIHPITKNVQKHTGIDIVGRVKSETFGKNIYSSTDGTIISIKDFNTYKNGAGNRIHIVDNFKNKHSYFHLSDNNFGLGLKNGQKVKQGQKIGEIGTTGNSTGPHLHYEIWNENNIALNPRLANMGLKNAPNISEVREFEYEFENS